MTSNSLSSKGFGGFDAAMDADGQQRALSRPEEFFHMGRAVVYRFGLVLLTLTVFAGSVLAAPARAQVIPESGTLALFGSGLVGLAALIRRHFSE
jgi:hypothetical protein